MAIPEGWEGGTQVVDPDAVRAEWLERLNALALEVKGWVEPAGWRTRLASKPTRDSVLGRFEVPLLLMERDGVEVALNPASRFVSGSEGAVDLYVVPAYDEVAGPYFEAGHWVIYHVTHEAEAAGIREPEGLPLSETTLTRVLDEMATRGGEQIGRVVRVKRV
jgi:hypothetical protein